LRRSNAVLAENSVVPDPVLDVSVAVLARFRPRFLGVEGVGAPHLADVASRLLETNIGDHAKASVGAVQ
jgi:hypothetical protein